MELLSSISFLSNLCSIDGFARVGATLSGELLNAVFANIGQRAVRKVARETFEHLLNLDLRFHLNRQTGGLTRAIDRGTKGISFMLQAILFRIAPTALEISLVSGILVSTSTFIRVPDPRPFFRLTNSAGISLQSPLVP